MEYFALWRDWGVRGNLFATDSHRWTQIQLEVEDLVRCRAGVLPYLRLKERMKWLVSWMPILWQICGIVRDV